MYYQENNGYLAESYSTNNPTAWVFGDMSNAKEAPDQNLVREGKLFPYIRDAAIYHCPGDTGATSSGKTVATSVRSYSINSFMGGRENSAGAIPDSASDYVKFFAKDADLLRPSDLFVMIDEDERSINDGFFITDPAAKVWYDFPAFSQHRHSYSFGVNFADGRAEMWRAHDPRSREVAKSKTEQSNNSDLQHLAAASTLRK